MEIGLLASTVINPKPQKREIQMTENEYNETFDMRMEREHQQTFTQMKEL